MTRTMFDSVNPAAIPHGAQMVAGYLNGNYAWSAAAWKQFAHITTIRIDVIGNAPLDAGVLDVENGDATPHQAPAWVKKRSAAGFRATIYCNKSTWPAVQAACKGLTVSYWIADWTHVPHELPGAVAVQWTNGAAFDTSAVYDNTWHPAHGAAVPAWVVGARTHADALATILHGNP